MILTELQIDTLLEQKSISNEWPWSTNNEQVIDGHIADIVADVCREVRLKDKSEYNHYGSGYSSFVDCWLYREDDDFRFATGDCYWGLVVLISRLSRYYVVGEGQKTWHSQGGSSYLPCFEFVDQIEHRATTNLVEAVCNVLDSHGLVRLTQKQLSGVLSRDLKIPTILTDPPWHHFDAIFYWED